MLRRKPHIFLKTTVGIFTILFLSYNLYLHGIKSKSEFEKVSGRIVYLDDHYQRFPNRHFGKYRYLKVDKRKEIFELFIGQDKYDNTPKFERIDSLKIGDIVEIYYETQDDKTGLNINRRVHSIDKQSQPYFIRSGKDKVLGIIGMVIGAVFLIILLVLKQKEIIE